MEKRALEKLFGMSSGYVLGFSDRTFAELFADVEIDIDAQEFRANGTSKANRLRTFWRQQDDRVVGKLLDVLIDHWAFLNPSPDSQSAELSQKCRGIAQRLLSNQTPLNQIKLQARILDGQHLAEQVKRIEAALPDDPALAIGTSKELLETCCKTILSDRGEPFSNNDELPKLTKETLRSLKLLPDQIPDSARGVDSIRRLLSNLGSIGHSLAEIRNLYGTGHGKHARAKALKPRHARLAVGAAATLASFLFETHRETMPRAAAVAE